MIKKAHYFQHVPFEDLGEIEAWLKLNQFQIDSTRFFNTWNEPNIEDLDFLIIMGGPMSVDEFEKHPWIEKEIEFIQKAIEKGIYVLGICLGAQLIAAALGASVYKNQQKEIGWYPIEKVQTHRITQNIPIEIQAFHWHGDTFNLPEKSIHLYKSNACQNQGFLYKDKVLGLQFHLESNNKTISNLISNCGDELTQGQFIHSEPEIRELTGKYSKESNNHLFKILDSFICF